jgi:hypothetical protein
VAFFQLHGMETGTCMLLSGRDPAAEADMLAAEQELLVGLLAGTGCEPGFGLLSITERPALVRIELRSGLSAEDLCVLSELALSLAAVFFERVATPHCGRIDQG